ncbi:hypothetical protein MMC22_004814 [Lobaria immixta]|nr:hypothetical protein [Lobaria immixta]
MADPFSISASIAGLVNLADVVFGRIYKYVKAVKNASKDMATLSSEIGALYGILSSLRLISDQLENGLFESTTRPHHIHSCLKTLERVKSILERDDAASSQNHRLQTLKRNLRWPFTSSEVKDLVIEIERHKATLGLALNVDGMSGLLLALSKQTDINESMKGIQKELRLKREAETRITIDEGRQKVLNSFGTIDPRRNHDMSRKLRHPSTGLWLTESPEFKLWLTTTNARLWLYGIPGAGKTVLASLVIDEILSKTNLNIAAAYFYCDYKDPKKQEPYKILSCLAQQLAKQDEQSFAKVQKFYEIHGQGRKYPVEYEPTDLCHLITEISTDYDCTIVVVDGLDECGTNAGLVTELLSSLNNDEGDADFKTLFLSRDEVDIRECLKDYPSISIAAQRSDLRLYVGAEIENRTRKKMLNIKTPELKEHVRERLVEGAEGMFRWVTCQMDYLCELPNDAARRKALKNLPRGLYPTYERLLRRVNASNEEAQKLVQRTLKWIAHSASITTEQLCEAISINLGDKYRDVEAIPDKTEILRNCSSLVRLSVDGSRFEFAHFTVEEFLKNLDGTTDGEFAAYHISPKHIENELFKICLTYLNFLDFDKGGNTSMKIVEDRFIQYPFRKYVASWWEDHACHADWNDTQLFSLATEIFHPSKPNTLISLVQDQGYSRFMIYPDEDALANINCGIREATALHYAAMYSLPEVCKWLVENGCDVNRRSAFGTPLHCAQISGEAFCAPFQSLDHEIIVEKAKALETFDVLLNAGADPSFKYHSTSGELTPLLLAVHDKNLVTARRLLQKGAIVDDQVVNLLIEKGENDEAWDDHLDLILEFAKNTSLGEETRARALQYALKAQNSGVTELFPLNTRSDTDKNDRNRHSETSLRTAAEYGQVEAVLRLLDDHGVDIDAAEENSILTALHYASMNDHLEVAQVLLERGANPSKADCFGRTALHYCLDRKRCRCLSYFLKKGLDVTVTDKENLTVWHLAVLGNNIEALKILVSHVASEKPTIELKGSKKRPLISCASQRGSAEAVSLLLDAGCSASDLDLDGCTALHHGAKAGSPEVVRLLVAQGVDTSAKTHDGSSTVHYAIMGNSAGLDVTLEVLIDDGVNPFIGRKDGITPMHLLIGDGTDNENDLVREKALQRLARLPNSFQGKQEDLKQTLNVICQLQPSQDSTWLLTGLETLLENGADLMSKSDTGQTALEALLAVWQGECLKQDFLQPRVRSITISSKMVLAALKHIPTQGPLHEICAAPGLLLSAIKVSKDELVYKLLDYSPDVDKIIDESDKSPIKAACQIGRSRTLVRKLLDRSNALSDKALGADLVRETCRQGNEKNHIALLELLEAGLDPNGLSLHGETALMFAALAGNIDMAESLLSHGSDAKVKDHAGRTVAHYACTSGHQNVLYALRDKGIDWNAKANTMIMEYHREGVTVLHLAAVLEDDSVLKYLLGEDFVKDVNGVTDMKETALFMAAWNSNTRNVALLLSKNGDPALVADPTGDDPEESSVHIAARLGDTSVMSEFINYGCNLKIPNNQGLDSEMIAWKYGHTELAKMIGKHTQEHKDQDRELSLVAGAQQRPGRASEPLRVAITIGDLGMCKRIVQQGVDLDAGYRDCNGCTPLLYSLRLHQPTIAEYLALEGASPAGKICHKFNPLGHSVFHLAAWLNYSELLRILLERHPDQYLHLTDPLHPFHLAIVSQATGCVSLMLSHVGKEDTSTSTASSQCAKNRAYHLANLRVGILDASLDPYFPVSHDTPLKLAIMVESHEIARLLLEAGGLVDDGVLLHETPLHNAASLGDEKTVKLLLELGANPQVRDCNLATPAMLAAAGGHLQALQALSGGRADLQILDQSGNNALYYAVLNNRTEAILYLMATMNGYDLAQKNKFGESILGRAFRFGKHNLLTLLLNIALSPGAYCPGEFNILTDAVVNPSMTAAVMRMLLRRVPQELLPTLLTHRARIGGTALYAACTQTDMSLQSTMIGLLLDTGVGLDTEGGDYGTPLMGACATGRLQAVKLLVRKGAKIFYCNERGRNFSALDAAKHFPGIVRWLLVGRYTEGPGLLTNGGIE